MTENSEAVEVQSVFIAAGCNRIVNNVSWGACGLVSFGSQNAVAIFCPKTARILTTVPGHKASVNCTQWIPSTKFAFRAQRLERHYLLSGDSEGVIILWEFSLIDTQWRQVMKLPQLHKKGVTCIAGIMVSQTDSIFASSSSDGVVNIWDLVLPFTPGGECKLSCFESLSVGSKPMVALSLAELPGSSEHIVLAMGGLDNKIHVYCGQKAGKTTRIFSPWKTEASSLDGLSWHEIARPQVHGHDINCVAFIEGKRNQRFICGADEKVARVFEAPLSFLKTLSHASQQSALTEDLQTEVQILGANMSALGLSQKPIYQNAVHETPRANGNDGLDTLESVPDAIPVIFTEPPIEDQLAYHTLWPESHKLYGHGNELFSLCCDHEGGLVASSCKAQSQSVAEIWLWQVGSWKSVGRLQSHTLTVTQMEFSHDDSMLLAVSRDRQFSVFSIKRTGDEISYQLLAKQEAHKRIIWSCSWNPFGHEFATGSRDKTVKIWTVDGTKSSPVRLMATLPPFSSSVTAVAWLGIDRHRSHGLLAVGMENGLIELWHITVKRDVDNGTSASGVDAALAIRFDPAVCHVSQVNRLSWRSSMKSEDSTTVQLASCGADHCVRLFEVRV
ncbi:Elongator complex protein 2 [Linum perenne]